MGAGVLWDFDVKTTSKSDFGSIPGFALLMSGMVGANAFTEQQFTVSSHPTAGAPMSLGFTDMTDQWGLGSGVGRAGVATNDLFDEGIYSIHSTATLVRSFAIGSNTEDVGTYAPSCFDGLYSYVGASLTPAIPTGSPGAALLLGNKCSRTTGVIALNSSTGHQSITGVGFQPDLVIFLGCGDVVDNEGNNSDWMLGCMDASGNQWASTTSSVQGSGQSLFGGLHNQTLRYSRFINDGCIVHVGADSELSDSVTVDQRAEFVSMDSNGFTINLTAAGLDGGGDQMNTAFLAIKIDSGAGSVAVGNGVQGDASITCGFQPDVMLFGACHTTTTSVSNTLMYASVGMTDGTKQRAMWFGSARGNVGDIAPVGFGYWSNAASIFFADASQTIKGAATAAFTGTGANLTWTTDDSTDRLFGWIAFAIDTGDFAPTVETDAATGVTARGALLNGEIVPNTDPGEPVNYRFDWGFDTSYGNSSHTSADGSGPDPSPVSLRLTDLEPATEYHFRVAALRGGCEFDGDDETFTTPDVASLFLAHSFRIGTADSPAEPDTSTATFVLADGFRAEEADTPAAPDTSTADVVFAHSFRSSASRGDHGGPGSGGGGHGEGGGTGGSGGVGGGGVGTGGGDDGGGAGGTPDTTSFDDAISYSAEANRPAFAATNTINFTNQAQLEAAIASATAGTQIINTNSTGGFAISGEWEGLAGLRPTGIGIKIDFGTDANRVRWSGTSLHSNLPAVWIHDSANLQLYGGLIENDGGPGLLVMGGSSAATQAIRWWNLMVQNTGSHGISMLATNPSGGGSAISNTIRNCSIQVEVTNWGTDYLTLDGHSEKGTGIHACLLADVDNAGAFIQNEIAIYGHDAVPGNCIEIGQDGPQEITDNDLYIKADTITFDALHQVAANALAIWGDTPNTGMRVRYLEASNLEGRAVDANDASPGQFSGVTVEYGRATNTNLNPHLGSTESGVSASEPWDTRGGVVYVDVA